MNLSYVFELLQSTGDWTTLGPAHTQIQSPMRANLKLEVYQMERHESRKPILVKR